jgi:hypothetical protein
MPNTYKERLARKNPFEVLSWHSPRLLLILTNLELRQFTYFTTVSARYNPYV